MSSPTPPSPARRLRFIDTADAARAPSPRDLHLVLDTSWTPIATDRPDVRPVRPAFSSVVQAHDLFAEALDLVDRWGASADAAAIVQVEGVTYWFRLREELWHWTHERLLWRYALTAIDPEDDYGIVSIPDGETALLDVLEALGRTVEIETAPVIDPSSEPAAESAARRLPYAVARFLPASLRRALRQRGKGKARGGGGARRAAALERRLARLLTEGGDRVIVLTLPSSYQRVGSEAAAARIDPNLGSVIPALAEAGLQPIVIGWGMRGDRPEDLAALELDDRLLPAGFIQARWSRPEDADRARSAIDDVTARWREPEAVPFRLDGLDMTAAFASALRDLVGRVLSADVPMLARFERLIDEVGPRAIVMTQEGRRLPVLIAASRAGVPTFALQHGILYSAHPGYPDRRHPALVLPTCTFVFGEYERTVLEHGAYLPGEVVVSGSPRIDVESAAGGTHDQERDRASVRGQLGVAAGDLMLVISTLHQPFVRRSHFAHMLEATLGGPLPGIHVVFKLHPGERDEGPYRALLTGLARAGGHEPPPMTVVKDIDLYRLLRAADAHLGQHSTVLTDAVIAGTTNLISLADGNADLLGYVPAGVARPVRDVHELLTALRHPERPSDATRDAFLRAHFHDGSASVLIAETIREAVREPAGTGVAV